MCYIYGGLICKVSETVISALCGTLRKNGVRSWVSNHPKEGAMIVWLVLVLTGFSSGIDSPRMMHVGNFASFTECEKAAAAHTAPVKAPDNPPQVTMLCIPANALGSQPPPY